MSAPQTRAAASVPAGAATRPRAPRCCAAAAARPDAAATPAPQPDRRATLLGLAAAALAARAPPARADDGARRAQNERARPIAEPVDTTFAT